MSANQSSDIKALFGRRMRELRRHRNLSQEAFAHVVGLDRSYVGGIERGERNISIENIWLICQALEVSLAEFFALAETPAASIEKKHQENG